MVSTDLIVLLILGIVLGLYATPYIIWFCVTTLYSLSTSPTWACTLLALAFMTRCLIRDSNIYRITQFFTNTKHTKHTKQVGKMARMLPQPRTHCNNESAIIDAESRGSHQRSPGVAIRQRDPRWVMFSSREQMDESIDPHTPPSDREIHSLHVEYAYHPAPAPFVATLVPAAAETQTHEDQECLKIHTPCSNRHCYVHSSENTRARRDLLVHRQRCGRILRKNGRLERETFALKENNVSLKRKLESTSFELESVRDELDSVNEVNGNLIEGNQHLEISLKWEKERRRKVAKLSKQRGKLIESWNEQLENMSAILQESEQISKSATPRSTTSVADTTELNKEITELEGSEQQTKGGLAAQGETLAIEDKNEQALDLYLQETTIKNNDILQLQRQIMARFDQKIAAWRGKLTETEAETEKHKQNSFEIFKELAILQIVIRFNLGLDALLLLRSYTSEELTELAQKTAAAVDEVYQLHLQAMATMHESDVAISSKDRLRSFAANLLKSVTDRGRRGIFSNGNIQSLTTDDNEIGPEESTLDLSNDDVLLKREDMISNDEASLNGCLEKLQVASPHNRTGSGDQTMEEKNGKYNENSKSSSMCSDGEIVEIRKFDGESIVVLSDSSSDEFSDCESDCIPFTSVESSDSDESLVKVDDIFNANFQHACPY